MKEKTKRRISDRQREIGLKCESKTEIDKLKAIRSDVKLLVLLFLFFFFFFFSP